MQASRGGRSRASWACNVTRKAASPQIPQQPHRLEVKITDFGYAKVSIVVASKCLLSTLSVLPSWWTTVTAPLSPRRVCKPREPCQKKGNWFQSCRLGLPSTGRQRRAARHGEEARCLSWDARSRMLVFVPEDTMSAWMSGGSKCQLK